MAFHFYVMNNILYLIEFASNDRIYPPLHHHHHHCRCCCCCCRRHRRHLTTFFFVWRLPPVVAISLSPILLSSTRGAVNTPIECIFRIIRFDSLGLVIASSVAVLSLPFSLRLCSINRHHPFIFTPNFMLAKITISYVMCAWCVQASHHCISFVNGFMEFFLQPTTSSYRQTDTHSLTHMHTLHMLKVE